jgi:hypothetical protein
LEDRWTVEYDEEPDSLFASLTACISSKIKNWHIIRGDQSLRTLLVVPVSDLASKEQKKIIGSEIETRIIAVDKNTSRLIVILRRSEDVLTDESRETVAKAFPVSLLLTLGETDEIAFDLQTIKDALSKHGGPITKTVIWHLNNHGFFEEKRGQQERLLANLRELLGPGGDLIMQDIMNRTRKKPDETENDGRNNIPP